MKMTNDDKPLPELSQAELGRYSRHLTLPNIGKTGQQRLKASKILIIGAGGLGSPLSLYLAAAGVGTLGIIDHDVVDESNLQRQVLFGVSDIGKSKAEQAARRINDLNPHVHTLPINLAVTTENAMDIIADYDLVIDGTDNFPTRYLANDACVLLGKPNIYGSIFRFEGQASVFNYQSGPCYRCLYPEPPPPGEVPSCAEGGVLGVLPAMIASIQATEAIKIVTGNGDSLNGRLILYDALRMQFHEMKLRKNPDCPVCGEHPTIRELINYEEFCGAPNKPAGESSEEITVQQLKNRLDQGEHPLILDVREPWERDICQLDNTTPIPKAQIAGQMTRLDKEREIIVLCKTGNRAASVCQQLKENGFERAVNLKGGIVAWAQEIDTGLQQY